MRKKFSLFLALFAGLTNMVSAAPISISTINTWQTATGSLISYQDQVGTASWDYDTDLSYATSNTTQNLPSGATITTFLSPSYTLTGTGGTSFEGQQFSYSLIDNAIVQSDIFAIPNSALVGNDLISKMINHGLNPDDTFDMVLFDINHPLNIQGLGVYLSGLNLFKKGFFSDPVASLPDDILSQSLFTYGVLTIRDINEPNPGIYGFASYAQAPSAVPVPAAAFMFAPALLGFLGLRRKTKRTTI